MSGQGIRIGSYELLRQVARSPGVSVWKARRADERDPSPLAVRLLDDPGDATLLARLRREYERLGALAGAGAPRPLGLFGGYGALAMEWREGASLRDVLQAVDEGELVLDEATVLEIVLAVARVLRDAHALPRPVVHGRLSPAEILLDRQGAVTLLGWGGWSPQVWTPGVPPEVGRGQPAGVSSDVWSVGALLAVMLSPSVCRERGLQAAVRSLVMRWPAAGRLLEEMLAASPARRPPSLAPVVADLLTLTRQLGGVASVVQLAHRFAVSEPGSPEEELPVGPQVGHDPDPPVVPPRPPAPRQALASPPPPGPAPATQPPSSTPLPPAASGRGEAPAPVAPTPSPDPVEEASHEVGIPPSLEEPPPIAQELADAVDDPDDPAEVPPRTLAEKVALALTALLLIGILASLVRACL